MLQDFNVETLSPAETGKIATEFISQDISFVDSLTPRDVQKLMAVLEVFFNRFSKRYEDIKTACLKKLSEQDIRESIPVHVEGSQHVAFSVQDVLKIATSKGANKTLKQNYSFSDDMIKIETKEMYVKDDDKILEAYKRSDSTVLRAIQDGCLPDPQTWVTQKKSIKIIK